MKDSENYKYLIDIWGYRWTDRVKLILAMGWSLLLVDCSFKEYYFDQLEAMVHYVPIKEDLSDLLEKIEYMDNHSKHYENPNYS